MQPFQDFSSWQPEHERHFVVFEQRTAEASRRAWAIGIFAGVAFGIAMIGITVAVPPGEKKSEAAAQVSTDLGAEPTPAAATTPSAAPADPAAAPADPATAPAATPTDPAAQPAATAPAGDPAAPASAPASGDPAAGAATPPPPPPGTTKAPPTDLVKDQK
jgi:hypothetical protein